MSTAHHVIFGTGAIGLATLGALRRRGETVRMPYDQWTQQFPELQAARAGGGRGHRRSAGEHGERLHVRAPRRPSAHRGPRVRRAHQEGNGARQDGPATPTQPHTYTCTCTWTCTLRELLEMQYQFAERFIVDSTKIASRLGVPATPLGEALTSTLAS